MTLTSEIPRQTTTHSPDKGDRQTLDASPVQPRSEPEQRPRGADLLEELEELPQELAGAVEAVREDIEATWVGRKAVAGYLWLMRHAPKSTRGRVTLGVLLFVIVLVPSLAMMYVSISAGQQATENWFGKLGYAGVFLANLAGTATLFIPVPALTAAAQALIVSSAGSLSPFWVGVLGGLGMAVGEVTAYVGGMAAALIAREEEIKVPSRLQPFIDKLTRGVNWLMARYGMPTLFTLSVFPNPLFEIAGWTAGATRYSFWRFMGAVIPGKVIRGLLLAYIGERLIFG
jgi:membrane protein DedA with SNARE-associated domain